LDLHLGASVAVSLHLSVRDHACRGGSPAEYAFARTAFFCDRLAADRNPQPSPLLSDAGKDEARFGASVSAPSGAAVHHGDGGAARWNCSVCGSSREAVLGGDSVAHTGLSDSGE